ncbi:hypothetical protein [Pseudomonas sp. B329]|uniref:hypothetical protein n=1 Tax=Pseudomonas sp. B329 TaxID=1553459 RepID=UPI0020056A21|nr:hypothetical protein [Pseudomonas sp. B329]MCK3864863.1 hypothetical protein [Pseudomonas sp. B329]
MANFKPLEFSSQGGTKPVLYVDSSAPQRELMDAAQWRLGAVKELLSVLICCSTEDGGRHDVAQVSRALLLLVDDAEALFQAASQAA